MTGIYAIDQGPVTPDRCKQWSLAIDMTTNPIVLKITDEPMAGDTVLMSVRVQAPNVSAAMSDAKDYFRGSKTFGHDDTGFLTIVHPSDKADLCAHFNHMEKKYGRSASTADGDLVYRVCTDVCTTLELQDRVRMLEEKLRLKNYELRLKDFEIRLVKGARSSRHQWERNDCGEM
jgi:hypothetical protein